MPASVQNEPSNLKYLMWQGNQDFVSSVRYIHIQDLYFFFSLFRVAPFGSISLLLFKASSLWMKTCSTMSTQPFFPFFFFFSIGLLRYEKQCQPHHNGISCLHSSFYCKSQIPIPESPCTSVRVNQLRTLNQAYPGPPVRKVYQRVPACRALLSSPHNNGMQRSEML